MKYAHDIQCNMMKTMIIPQERGVTVDLNIFCHRIRDLITSTWNTRKKRGKRSAINVVLVSLGEKSKAETVVGGQESSK